MKLSGNKTRGHVSSSFITHSLFFPILHFPVSSARYLLPVFQSSLSPTDTFGTGPLREMSGSASYPDVSLARAKEGGKECPAYRVKVT